MLIPNLLTACQPTVRIPSRVKVPVTNSKRRSGRDAEDLEKKLSGSPTKEVAGHTRVSLYRLLRRKASRLEKHSYCLDVTDSIRLDLMTESLACPVVGQAQRVPVSAFHREYFRAQTSRSGE